MKDLFGNETPLAVKPDKGSTLKANPLLSVYGTTDGKHCKQCAFFRVKKMGKTYFKCSLTKDTGGGWDRLAGKLACLWKV